MSSGQNVITDDMTVLCGTDEVHVNGRRYILPGCGFVGTVPVVFDPEVSGSTVEWRCPNCNTVHEQEARS